MLISLGIDSIFDSNLPQLKFFEDFERFHQYLPYKYHILPLNNNQKEES